MGSKSSTTTTMEDVDRLFECFKCGISPPQSAVRERKRSKGRMKKQGISIHEASPGSAEQPKKKKFVLKVVFQEKKIMNKIMKTTISLGGVDSVSIDREENKVVVIGDGIDAVDLVIKLREFCDAELVSLGPARNEKKIEPDNDHAIRYQNALAELTKSYQANPERYFGRCYNWRG